MVVGMTQKEIFRLKCDIVKDCYASRITFYEVTPQNVRDMR